MSKKDKKAKKKAGPESAAPVLETQGAEALPKTNETDWPQGVPYPLDNSFYEQELEALQFELVKLQYWIKQQGLRLVIIFEGRDAAGKGGLIKRLTEPLNPRGLRLVALPRPSDVEATQWYFQRYVSQLPSAGEIVIFDRSWYNRAGVEKVMGFCTDEQYWEFLRSCPEFERMLVRSGIVVAKYWLSVSDAEQERRLQDRMADPTKRWKISDIDIAAREKSAEYSKAKDMMFIHTDIPECHWYQVESDDKKRARLNTLRHLLSLIPYEDVIPAEQTLSPREFESGEFDRPPLDGLHIVPDYYADYRPGG
jgi:polyphosphate kinase 2